MNTKSGYPANEDLEIQRQRLAWLVNLRWYGAGSIILAALMGKYLFGLHLPMLPLFTVAAGMFIYNYYYQQKSRKPVFQSVIALNQLVLDVFSLTLVLFLSGGF